MPENSPVSVLPRWRSLLLVHVEPTPSTVTKPVEPEFKLIQAYLLLTVPPLVIFSVPLPFSPI
jgi:hypothetical protein